MMSSQRPSVHQNFSLSSNASPKRQPLFVVVWPKARIRHTPPSIFEKQGKRILRTYPSLSNKKKLERRMRAHHWILGGVTYLTLDLAKTTQAFRPEDQVGPKPKRYPSKGLESSVYVDVAENHVGSFIMTEQEQQRQVPMSVPRRSVPLVQLALAGSLTTFFADSCIHPVDCIKTLQQSDLGAELNFFEASAYLFETSGIRGFFNGLLTYACSDAVGGAIKFSVWETWKKKFTDPRLVWVGAAVAFMAASVVIAPGEFLKQQLQMSQYDSLVDAAISVYQQDGPAGFFLGYDAVVLRDVPHTILELCLYDIFKRSGSFFRRQGSSSKEEGTNPVLAAAMTGCVAGFLTTPMDAIKTKVMVDTSSTYESTWDCFVTTMDHHGWAGMWAGAMARVLWIAPFTMLYLPTYDFLHNSLLERHLRVSQFDEDPSSSSSFMDILDTNDTR
eukprot:scaffold2702_cov168-Amphora_coffeaeformis.AAC.10